MNEEEGARVHRCANVVVLALDDGGDVLCRISLIHCSNLGVHSNWARIERLQHLCCCGTHPIAR